MTINLVRQILARFTQLDENPEELDARINLAQNQRFAQCYEQKDFESLRPFKANAGEDNVPLYVINGRATLPGDYFAYESATIIKDGVSRQLEFVEDAEFDNRKQNYIEIPNWDYPLGNLHYSYMRVLPKDIQYILLNYFIAPPDVKFGYTKAHGYVEYDPLTSVDLMWNAENVTAIILLVLQGLGIKATAEQVKQASQ